MRVDRTHWKRFVESFALRQHRITKLQGGPVVPIESRRVLKATAATRRTATRPVHRVRMGEVQR